MIDAHEFLSIVQQTAIAHREAGDPNQLADAIPLISETCTTPSQGERTRRMPEQTSRR